MANQTSNLPYSAGRRTPAGRAGFSLVELLVVIAIIALLVALILPAVQAARESARLADCKNRMRQIALALHHYHDARRSFPSGVEVKERGECLGFESHGGTNWLIEILPYVEEQALSALYEKKLYNESPENAAVRTTFVSTYSCPGDEQIGQKIVPALGRVAPAEKANIPYMSGSYRGVSGESNGLRFLDAAPPVSLGYAPNQRGVLHAVGTGLEKFSRERFRTITDGKSHTLMVGESVTRTNPGIHTLWAYSHDFYALSAVTKQDRVFWGDYDRCISVFGVGGNLPCQRGWGSSHHRLLNFAFVDASVRSLSDSIDMTVLSAMATIAGGETPLRSESE
jgi:prepilin-type N-terminal cleavage/methylation domain-containing protein